MLSWATLRPWIVVAAVTVPWVVVWPAPRQLARPIRGLDAPVDDALRVPFGAAFLGTLDTDFETHDRVLDVVFGDEQQTSFPRNRAELWSALEKSPSSSVALRVARGRETAVAHATRVTLPGWQVISRNWPPIFLGAAFLVFGLTIALGSRHPVAQPLFALSWCVAASLLAQLDLILPGDPGLHGIPSLRSRLGVVGLTLLPASLIHLAMRFPVVAPRLRSPAVVAVPYVFWLFPAGFAQLHLHDATFLNTLEKIAIGATFVAAAILAIGSLTAIRTMTPIERARTRALLFGLGLGSAVPLVYFLWGGQPPLPLRTPFALSVLAFPAAISWAVVRYGLLDPPAWIRSAFLTGLSAVVALLCASGLVSLTLSLLGEPAAAISTEVVPVALTTTALYQLLHFSLRRGAAGRILRERAFEQFLEDASRELAAARLPEVVLERVEALLAAHLGASRVRCVTRLVAPAGGDPLVRGGLHLWLREGARGNGSSVSAGGQKTPVPTWQRSSCRWCRRAPPRRSSSWHHVPMGSPMATSTSECSRACDTWRRRLWRLQPQQPTSRPRSRRRRRPSNVHSLIDRRSCGRPDRSARRNTRRMCSRPCGRSATPTVSRSSGSFPGRAASDPCGWPSLVSWPARWILKGFYLLAAKSCCRSSKCSLPSPPSRSAASSCSRT